MTVIAPTAAEADALSTAFYLTGPVGALRLIDRNPLLSALFLRVQADSGDPELLALNLPRERLSVGEIRTAWVDRRMTLPENWAGP